MTDEQKFLFDLNGWLLIPGVLESEQIALIKEHLEQLKNNPDQLESKYRHCYAGPVAELHDHPVAVDILRCILGKDINEKAYGFRLDGCYSQYRETGNGGLAPHGGGPNVNPNFSYQCKNQMIYSALTRVVWELNEVEHGKGGTLLMSGSHKANFTVPKEHRVAESFLFDTYSCPPGSLLFFTENLCHAGDTWQMPDPRMAVFNAYTSHQAQFHKSSWNPETIAEWPEKRQSLVRGVWHADFSESRPPKLNDWYGDDNKAY
ncbi:MAG: phytanoyl-CoA dioxygenase family protein [Lentisphaeria bacterium]|nr:phytanoyl-CoA dioxygenase family protein [Lentisphaeria bacterium]NQZ71035.1 phytanoyl-CoA dioxygenase family protein [Lentisphaeria bacterium]